jgi:hypothetical protein
VNLWLAEEGWAYPAFYNSMTKPEIEVLLAAAKQAKNKKTPLWKNYSKSIALNEQLTFREPTKNFKPIPDPKKDKGPVILPKLFRRLVRYAMFKKAKIESGSFQKYLMKTPDYCNLLNDFLSQGSNAAQIRSLDEFFDSKGKFTLEPQELVFREKPSTLVDANGKKITTW